MKRRNYHKLIKHKKRIIATIAVIATSIWLVLKNSNPVKKKSTKPPYSQTYQNQSSENSKATNYR
jgi:hypothetical protein